MAQIKRSGTCTSTVVFKMFCICAFLSLKGCNKRPIEFTGNVIVKKKQTKDNFTCPAKWLNK